MTRSVERVPTGVRVLNAFRHHRGGHVDGALAIAADDACAQRLSASQRSTAIAADSRRSPDGDVLNAFRHHRGGHARARRRSDRASGAQRLSASQRWASCSAVARHPSACRCAQRLSASQRWAAGRVARVRPPYDVLNAFRHQEVGIRPGPSVAASTECSTPFGITEVGMLASWSTGDYARHVLNAFRHHRGRHGTAR